MSEILLDEQGKPTTPAAGQMLLYPDSGSSAFAQLNDSGRVQGDAQRSKIAQQAGFATDTYLTDSGLLIPSSSMQDGMSWEWKFAVVKTAAGVTAPQYRIRIGAAQAIADTERLLLTGPAQTAVVDTGFITVLLTCRSVGVAGVLQGLVHLQHNLAATGLANTPAGFSLVQGTSAGFNNSALGGLFVGLSINGGGSAAWTIEQVLARTWYGG